MPTPRPISRQSAIDSGSRLGAAETISSAHGRPARPRDAPPTPRRQTRRLRLVALQAPKYSRHLSMKSNRCWMTNRLARLTSEFLNILGDSESYRVEPELGVTVPALDVDVWWFRPFVAEEEESVAFDPKNRSAHRGIGRAPYRKAAPRLRPSGSPRPAARTGARSGAPAASSSAWLPSSIDAPRLEHQDAVGHAHGREAVRDQDRRCARRRARGSAGTRRARPRRPAPPSARRGSGCRPPRA